MLAYAFFMTLLVGFFIGFISAVALAIKLEKRQAEIKYRMTVHPSTRVGANPFTSASN